MTRNAEKIKRALVAEELFTEKLINTKAAKGLRKARNELLKCVRETARSSDMAVIIATERAIVEGDLTRYANSPEMSRSLTAALSEIEAIEKNMAKVAEPRQYQAVNEAHELPRNRKGGLPYDEARQAMASHGARLENLSKARLSAEEKTIINARRTNMRTAEAMYKQMQAEALGIDIPKAKAEELSC